MIKKKRASIYTAYKTAQKTKKRSRRSLLLSIAALLTLGFVMASVFAEDEIFVVQDGRPSGNSEIPYEMTYRVLREPDAEGKGGEVALIRYSASEGNTSKITRIDVPETVERTVEGEEAPCVYTVTEIGCYDDGSGEKGAFEDATYLTKLGLPGTLRLIETNAFKNAVFLSDIYGLVKSVMDLGGIEENKDVKIEKGAFYGCCFLDEAFLPDDDARNPAPFGDSENFVEIMVELRGIDFCQWGVGGDALTSGESFRTRVSLKRLYQGTPMLRLTLVCDTKNDDKKRYQIAGLARIAKGYGTDLGGDYKIDYGDGFVCYSGDSGAQYTAYHLPKCETEEEFLKWKERPVIVAVARNPDVEKGIVPTVTMPSTSDLELESLDDVNITLEAEHLTPDSEWTWTQIRTNAEPLHLKIEKVDDKTGRITGKIVKGDTSIDSDSGKAILQVRVYNDYSFHDRVFLVPLPEDDSEQDDPDDPGTDPDTEKPQNLRWDVSENLIKATWDTVDGVSLYSVELYKEGTDEAIENLLVEDLGGIKQDTLSWNVTDFIKTKYGEGSYYFKVCSAYRNGSDTITFGEQVSSEIYTYTSPSSETKQYTITASVDPAAGGSITPSGAVKVEEGASQAFTVTADKDYYIESLVVDGKSVGRISSYTFSDVHENHEIVANFKLIQNRIGDVKPSYPAGENVSFTAYGDGMENTSPKSGDIRWKPQSWSIDDKNSVDFEQGKTTGTIEASDLSAGSHGVRVTFVMQEYNGTEWVTVEGIPHDTRTVEFLVEGTPEGDDPTKEPDEAPNDPTDPTDPTDPDEEQGDPTEPTDPDGEQGDPTEPTDSDGEQRDPTEPADPTDNVKEPSGDEADDPEQGDSGKDGSDKDVSGEGLSSITTTLKDTAAAYFTDPKTGDVMPSRVILAAALLAVTASILILLCSRKFSAKK